MIGEHIALLSPEPGVPQEGGMQVSAVFCFCFFNLNFLD